MERIGLKDLPQNLNDDIINILAYMANEIPQSKDWHDIFEVLSDVDYRQVMDRRSELQYQEEESRKAAMTEEEKAKETAIWKKIKEDPEPKFYGNMGEPETPEEFKRKYGYDPRGADYNKGEE